MIASNQNSIHTAVLNFEYESKAAAIRNNVLIESIFNSHILSALEKTISRIVPNGIHVELSKLEIDIGSIKEKEMSTDLSLRIASTLAEALNDILKASENSSNGSARLINSGKDDILLNALEFYFCLGYFPLWVDSLNTVEDLLAKTLRNNKDEFIHLLLKLGGHEYAIRRIAYAVSDKLFDKLLWAFQPTNAKWMIDFKKTLFDIKKKSGPTAVTNKEFSKNLHFFILRYLVNNKSPIFTKTKFSDSILMEVVRMPDFEALLFLKTINAHKGRFELKGVLSESLAKLRNKNLTMAKSNLEQELNLQQLLVQLNAKSSLDVQETFFSKRLLKALRDPEESTILYNGLNETGAIQVLNLAYPNKANDLLQIIKSVNTIEVAGKSALSVKELVKATLRYLNESAIRRLNNEEYIFFLFQISGFVLDQSRQSDKVKSLIQNQRNFSLKKLENIIEIERDNPEISNITAVLSKSGDKYLRTASGRITEINQTHEYFAIYSRKIVWHYLTLGDLPEPYSDLTRKDVQQLFHGLMGKEDDFLTRQLSTYPSKQKLIDRLEVLFALNASYKAVNMPLPKALLPENKKVNSYLTQLYAFSPGSLSTEVNRELWKRVVGRFAILTCIENEKYDLTSFVLAFMNYVRRHLKLANAQVVFDRIVDQMKLSELGKLREIVEIWKVSNMKQTLSNHISSLLQENFSKNEDITPAPAKRIFYYVSILKFYAHRGFFPWWTDKVNFADVVEELKRLKQFEPRQFEDSFDQFEKEEPFFEQLLHQWPQSFVHELEHLFSNRGPFASLPKAKLHKPALKEHFKEKYPVSKIGTEKYDDKRITVDTLFANEFKNTENSFQTLYHIEDVKILAVWDKDNPEMAKQISKYIMLAPYFYFRNLSPIRWRKIVYEFSHAFYGQDHRKPMTEFHHELLRHLEQKYSHIDWKGVFTSVYQMTRRSGGTMPKEFPEEMAVLIEAASMEYKGNVGVHQGNDLTNHFDGDQGTKVANAGLILFWPFLTRFFEQLSLTKNGNFVNDRARNTAVYLLQYLAFNTIDFPEHQMVVNKVLVGMPPQKPLFPFPELSDEAKNMAQSLMNGLIVNWEKVKGSTPEGIQETFIQREGLLTFKTDRIVLKVDKKGVDVLLDFIPWNISLVKLPWMRLPLYVEWI